MKEIVVTHMAMAFLVTKICLFIIGPKKREGKLMRIAKSTRNFKSQDMIKKICHKLILVKLILRDLLAMELQNKHFLLPTCITNRADEVRS